MSAFNDNITFSGERFVPGGTARRIASDHWERYRFACLYVRDKRVLDVACGVGYAAPLLVKAGAKRYHGIDISPDCIDHALRNYASDAFRLRSEIFVLSHTPPPMT